MAQYLIIIAVVSYLLGCLNGAILVSKILIKRDIRESGSGNAGVTNFYRTFGGSKTLIVFLIDIAKCVIAVLPAGYLMGTMGYAVEGKMLAGLFVMLGHMFPVFFRFKGGKGVLSGGTLVALVDWRVFIAVMVIFGLTVLITRYVSLGAVFSSVAFPFLIYHFQNGNVIVTVLGTIYIGFVIFMHRANIVRIIRGQESKFSLHKKK